MAKHNEIGALGEEIACRYLLENGFFVKERNYLKKWGEIDIVATRAAERSFVSGETKNCMETLHFIEVKSVSCEMPDNFSHETLDNVRPEENVHKDKVKRLSRAIQSYIAEKHVSPETYWEFSVIAVFIDPVRKRAAIRLSSNVVL